jgi:phosphatidylglycerol:prolipoprotein diacylglycerol transferase
MNGLVINIDPVIWSYGTFELRWYSLTIMLAVAVAVMTTAYLGRKKGIAPGETYSIAMWVVIAGILGARLLHIIDTWEYYAGNPLQILQLQQGGLAIWGALAGGGLAVVYLARRNHIPLGRLVDAVAPGLLVAQIIGRVGCIINGDAYGGITSLPWAFIYVHPNALIPGNLFALPMHPYPVYEIAWNVLALFIIWRLSRYFQRDGLVFLSYLSFYSLGRFILTFVRQENVTFWGLQQAQIIALHVIVVSVVAMVYLFRKRCVPERMA